MTKLSKKNFILVTLTLFSMFFGAGNLIFPPFLGNLAGKSVIPAMIGFNLTAIGFPILGVIAVACSGGLKHLASRVHPYFAFIFTLLIYLSIGPCLAIPRTASTSFEMAVQPYVSSSLGTIQFIYSVIFFAIALYLALNPAKLTQYLGKILTPILLVLIAVLFIGSFFYPSQVPSVATETYKAVPFVQGFLDGYLTMDTIAALNFGIIISMNVKALGVKDEKSVVKTTIQAGLWVAVIFILVYSALAYLGFISSHTQQFSNGAQVLTYYAKAVFGDLGVMILGLIFAIACLNTSIGLISCVSEYFAETFPKFTYKTYACFFAFISMIISNVGLTQILKISVPVLSILYPISIVLIVLGFLHPFIKSYRYIYPITIGITALVSIVLVMGDLGLLNIQPMFKHVPLYSIGLGWVLISVVALVFSLIFSMVFIHD